MQISILSAFLVALQFLSYTNSCKKDLIYSITSLILKVKGCFEPVFFKTLRINLIPTNEVNLLTNVLKIYRDTQNSKEVQEKIKHFNNCVEKTSAKSTIQFISM